MRMFLEKIAVPFNAVETRTPLVGCSARAGVLSPILAHNLEPEPPNLLVVRCKTEAYPRHS